MAKYMMRAFLMMKARIKSPFTYIWVALLVFSLWLVDETIVPTKNSSDVAILNEAGEYGERVTEFLTASDEFSECTFLRVEDEDMLRLMVRRGRVRCGFILPEDMEERIEEGDTRSMITMVTSTFSVKSAAVREKVFAALYRIMNPDITVAAAGEYFEDPEGAASYIRERYDYYVGSDDVFRINYERLDDSKGDEGGFFPDRSDPVRGTAAVLIFVLCLYSGSTLLGKNGRFFRAFGRHERLFSEFLYLLTSVLIPSVCAFAAIRFFAGDGTGLMRDLLCFALFLILTAAWSTLFVSCFKKNDTYLPAVSVLLFASFVLCPVFFDPGKYFQVAGYVVRLLPPAFYIYLL